MSLNYLFPNKYKRIGWIVLIPSVIVGVISLVVDIEPAFLDFEVPTLVVNELLQKTKFFGFSENNLFDEIIGALIVISGILVAFSKEKSEDELIAKIRMEALTWATYVNYAILLFAILFIYDFAFFWVMIFNMFTVLIIFIIRLTWQISQLNRSVNHAE